MKPTLLSFFLFITILVNAQGIKGTLTDSDKNPIAYVNIYVPALKTGTTSNIEGEFELKLPHGEWEALFQYIGYKTITQRYAIDDSMQTIHLTMHPQNIQIKEIKVLASGEDPAYYVMRHAIAMAPYYNKQVAEYKSMLYLKGAGVMYKIPRLFKKKMEKEGIEKDKPFVMESLNKIHFELPDKLEQQVISMRTTGDDHSTNPMQMITTNLYNVSDYGIVSPVGRNALKMYRFELVGVFEDQNKLINQIKVIPKANGQGTFSGIINIVDGYWNIHSADLRFSMPMMEVSMRHLYGLVENNTWMPTSLDFEMDVSAFGFGLKYNYVASFSEYEVTLNDGLDHSLFDQQLANDEEEANVLDSLQTQRSATKQEETPRSQSQERIDALLQKEDLSTREMYKLERLIEKETERTLPPEALEIPERVKVDHSAIQNDSAYWAQLRPIPLTGDEVNEFGKKDSLVTLYSTPEYQDSIRDVHQKFKITDLVMGRTYRYGADSVGYQSQFAIPGVINLTGLSFNTIDGWKYSLPFSFTLTDTLGHHFNINSSASYGFARKKLYAELSSRYRINGIKQQWIALHVGKNLEDFKGSAGISIFENDLYTLLFEENFQKFYEKKYLGFQGGSELVNGLNLEVAVGYANRSPVQNHSSYTGIDFNNKEYTPNIPVLGDQELIILHESAAVKAMVELAYTPRQRYRIRDRVKYPASSDFPTFVLRYDKGVNKLLGSDINYDLLKLGIRQEVRVGFNDYLRYVVTSAKYLNDDKLFVEDYTFFNSNDQVLTLSSTDNQFALPNYYQLYSKRHYVEAHAHLDMDRFLLKHLPMLKGKLIREKLKVSYLTSESVSNYLEVGYGLNDIFLLFDLEVTIGYQDWNNRQIGVRISMNLR